VGASGGIGCCFRYSFFFWRTNGQRKLEFPNGMEGYFWCEGGVGIKIRIFAGNKK